MNKIIKYLVVIIILSGSCQKDILDEMPPHLITSQTLFTNVAGFETALNGINTTVKYEYCWVDGMLCPKTFVWSGTDIMVSNNHGSIGFITDMWGDVNNSEVTFYKQHFAWLYSVVNAANTIINNAEKDKGIDWTGGGSSPSENKNRILAEAKGYRAWAYRHLTYGWGDVPLTLSESLGSNIKMDWVRTPVEEVRKQIISDLLFAEKYLSVSPKIRGKITKGAVQHYLAEMYLTVGKPDSALFWADKVVSNPEYALITKRDGVKKNQPGIAFMDMFYEGNTNREEGNTEALWVLQHEWNTPRAFGSVYMYIHGPKYWSIKIDNVVPLQITLERGGRGLGWYNITKWSIDNYESQDDRATNFAIRKYFILKDEAGNAPNAKADLLPPGYNYGDTIWLDWSKELTTADIAIGMRNDWPFSRKIEGCPPTALTDRNFKDHVYLRSAETYLLKAEAEHKLGLNENAANTINIIRRRSNASDVTAADINIDFILDERARELLMEEDRRYSLLRTGKWLERVKKYNKRGGEFAAEKDQLFPIPQNVIDANLENPMPQNPGYN